MEHVRCDHSAAPERCFDTDALMDSTLPALSDLAFEFDEADADTGVVGVGETINAILSFSFSPYQAKKPATPLLESRTPLDFTSPKTSPTSATWAMEAFFYDLDAEANKMLKQEFRAVHCLAPHVGISIHAHAGATPPPSSFGGW
jgi:hypothetical protein